MLICVLELSQNTNCILSLSCYFLSKSLSYNVLLADQIIFHFVFQSNMIGGDGIPLQATHIIFNALTLYVCLFCFVFFFYQRCSFHYAQLWYRVADIPSCCVDIIQSKNNPNGES
jgi:hypothetical protein